MTWFGKVIGFGFLGVFLGLISALIVWFFGKNPIRKIDGVSFYLAEPSVNIKISGKSFTVNENIYIYQREEDKGSKKYFILVRR